MLLIGKHHLMTDCQECSRESVPQWGEGYTNRNPFKVLDSEGKEHHSISHRQVCRVLKVEAKPFTAPPPPPLLKFRLQESRPLSYMAIDFAGPVHIKTFGVTAGDKVWICLYTCCVTRTVDMDVVPDMSAKTFVWNLKRFCARCGTVQVIISDNAKTFKAAAKEIQSHPDVQAYFKLSFK